MKFWKFSSDVEGNEPNFPIPTYDKVKYEYFTNNSSHFSNLFNFGIMRFGGWAFDFRDELKKFIVKCKDGDLLERWAPNRTILRKCMHTHLEYILDAPK